MQNNNQSSKAPTKFCTTEDRRLEKTKSLKEELPPTSVLGTLVCSCCSQRTFAAKLSRASLLEHFCGRDELLHKPPWRIQSVRHVFCYRLNRRVSEFSFCGCFGNASRTKSRKAEPNFAVSQISSRKSTTAFIVEIFNKQTCGVKVWVKQLQLALKDSSVLQIQSSKRPGTLSVFESQFGSYTKSWLQSLNPISRFRIIIRWS